MNENKRLILPVFAAAFILAAAGAGAQQLTPENAQDYLESGELSYTIEINFSRINWKEDDEYMRDIEKAADLLADNPRNTQRIVEYIAVCRKAGRFDLAAEAASKYYQIFQEEYKRTEDESSARRLLIAANQTGSREIQISAYETVRPFLELGDADIATVYAALQNREQLEDYHLGYRIAEFYQQVYPFEAELYFRGFLMTLNNSLHNTIPFMVAAIHERMEDMDAFLLEYYRALQNSVYLDMLDRAVELDSDNYQYLLSSVGFRAMVRWFSQLSTLMVEGGTDLNGIQDIFNSLELDQDTKLKEDLKKALELRPSPDHQVFLAAALFYTTTGDPGRAGEYVEKALETRPDLPEAYNAKVFLEMLSFADSETPPEAAQRLRIEEILRDKMDGSGKAAYDLYVLSALRLLTLREGGNPGRREQVLSEMEGLARESLEYEDTLLGHLSLGNSLLLQERYALAEEEYRSALNREPDALRYAPTANLGVAYMLQGKENEGKELIREAAEMTETNLHSASLLTD